MRLIALIIILSVFPAIANCATPITTRTTKGTPLTYAEMDANFTALRDATDGYAASLGASVSALQAGQGSGVTGYATKAAMDADLAHAAGSVAIVTNDASTTNNTFYLKLGGSGSGSWQKSAMPAALSMINASWYADLPTAISAQGATKATIFVGATFTLSADLTVPSNVSLVVSNAGVITINSGKVLTINGAFSAGSFQTFTGAGKVVFGASSVNEVYPQWFGAKGDNSNDDTSAINSAIYSLYNVGGTVIFPAGHYKITGSVQIGNGSSGGQSTYKPVTLKGVGNGGSPGDYMMGPSVFLENYYAGAAVIIQGPINSWGLENICLYDNSASALAVGLEVISAQYGRAKNVSIIGFKTGLLETTVGVLSLNYHNVFDSIWITLPNVSGALGIGITGTGTYGTAFEEYRNTYISTANASSTGISLAFCDNIKFYNTEITGSGSTGVLLNYANDAAYAYRTSMPSECAFFGLETYGNNVINYAPDGYGTPPVMSSNKIYGYSRANGATVPRLRNLSVIDDSGAVHSHIYRAAGYMISPGLHKVEFDTVYLDYYNLADVSTNYRITPNKAGAYVVSAGAGSTGDTGTSTLLVSIYKNGSPVAQQRLNNTGFTTNGNISTSIYMNGTTDYLELYVYQGGAGTVTGLNGLPDTYMSLSGPFGAY